MLTKHFTMLDQACRRFGFWLVLYFLDSLLMIEKTTQVFSGQSIFVIRLIFLSLFVETS